MFRRQDEGADERLLSPPVTNGGSEQTTAVFALPYGVHAERRTPHAVQQSPNNDLSLSTQRAVGWLLLLYHPDTH